MKSSDAAQLFRSGFNCSQSVVSVFADEYGIDKHVLRLLSSGFGGGMGGMQNVCGAASGAFMILGLKYGYGEESESYKKPQLYKIIQDFSREFSAQNGHLRCYDLLGCDLNTEDGKEFFKKNELRERVCVECVKNSVELLEKFLNPPEKF
ncbi:C-GCAxxG-C-C family protein [Flexistipes sinusarabici]|uniref:C_GCAxxG_C_C family protein n=1 Tax=Flexistipes sinusarabici TaxID=2352 RepID=A0A5D0MPG2_FLESI|nr:C-GCAxxG-C-C family protein [Flexistipes sinusarabici]TYB33198.1 MAG: C_GCAxxG_C_C family protein [Flexistipes sinusarabici]